MKDTHIDRWTVYAAAAALTGLLSNSNYLTGNFIHEDTIVQDAAAVADKMLEFDDERNPNG